MNEITLLIKTIPGQVLRVLCASGKVEVSNLPTMRTQLVGYIIRPTEKDL